MPNLFLLAQARRGNSKFEVILPLQPKDPLPFSQICHPRSLLPLERSVSERVALRRLLTSRIKVYERFILIQPTASE